MSTVPDLAAMSYPQPASASATAVGDTTQNRDVIGGTDGRVQMRLTVLDPSRAGARADVEVSVPSGTRLGAIGAELLAAVGHPS
jgi:hypothetical protein